jgi:hypothetical protein
MGAGQSIPPELAAQCHLPPEQVKQLVKAFQKKNKKGKPINRDVFMHVLSKLDYSLRAKSPLLVNHENLDVLFSMLDVNHDGARTCVASLQGLLFFASLTHSRSLACVCVCGHTVDVSEVVLGLSILAMGSLEEKAERTVAPLLLVAPCTHQSAHALPYVRVCCCAFASGLQGHGSRQQRHAQQRCVQHMPDDDR